jgi:hypothetical protein
VDTRTDLLSFIAEASGTHAFALSALQAQRRVTESQPIINPDNADPIIGWADGNPNVPGEIKSRPGWRRSQYLKNTEHGGMCSRYLGWAWVTLVYDRWDDDFRHRFAKEIGCSHGNLMCDPMGDLRHLRNDISHNKGIATSEHSGRCTILRDWFIIGTCIDIDISHPSRFYDLVDSNENLVYKRK